MEEMTVWMSVFPHWVLLADRRTHNQATRQSLRSVSFTFPFSIINSTLVLNGSGPSITLLIRLRKFTNGHRRLSRVKSIISF